MAAVYKKSLPGADASCRPDVDLGGSLEGSDGPGTCQPGVAPSPIVRRTGRSNAAWAARELTGIRSKSSARRRTSAMTPKGEPGGTGRDRGCKGGGSRCRFSCRDSISRRHRGEARASCAAPVKSGLGRNGGDLGKTLSSVSWRWRLEEELHCVLHGRVDEFHTDPELVIAVIGERHRC